MEKKLEDLENFEEVLRVSSTLKKGFTISSELYSDIKRDIDQIFRGGAYDLFTQGYEDIELLTPLFDIAFADFKKAAEEEKEKSKEKTKKYKVEK